MTWFDIFRSMALVGFLGIGAAFAAQSTSRCKAASKVPPKTIWSTFQACAGSSLAIASMWEKAGEKELSRIHRDLGALYQFWADHYRMLDTASESKPESEVCRVCHQEGCGPICGHCERSPARQSMANQLRRATDVDLSRDVRKHFRRQTVLVPTGRRLNVSPLHGAFMLGDVFIPAGVECPLRDPGHTDLYIDNTDGRYVGKPRYFIWAFHSRMEAWVPVVQGHSRVLGVTP